MKTRWRKALGRSTSILLGAVMGAAPFAQANEIQTRDVSSISLRTAVQASVAKRAPSANDQIEVFVQFERPSVAEFRAQYLENVGHPPSRQMQIAYAKHLRDQQASFRPMVRAYASKELSSMQVGANGIRLRTTPANMQRLRGLPGVKSVARVTTHYMDNAASVPWVGAPAVWDAYGDGEGITVAIIDSGIDYLHAGLGGAGDPDEYAANDKNVVEPGTFPTVKVIGGYDFAGPTYNPGVEDDPIPDDDPLDGNGHGTHVAGTAAGLGVEGQFGVGVAKGASLYAFKVFNDTSGS
ncbi:MAG: S8 family serine peptidase, partial [Pseudomonadota bacterium]